MTEKEGFTTIIADDLDHERLFCEIQYDGLFVALVSQERGDGVFDLEMPDSGFVDGKVMRKIDLDGFISAVDVACQRLRGELQ